MIKDVTESEECGYQIHLRLIYEFHRSVNLLLFFLTERSNGFAGETLADSLLGFVSSGFDQLPWYPQYSLHHRFKCQ